MCCNDQKWLHRFYLVLGPGSFLGRFGHASISPSIIVVMFGVVWMVLPPSLSLGVVEAAVFLKV